MPRNSLTYRANSAAKSATTRTALSAADQALIDAAWSQHAAALPAAAADLFAAMTVDDWRAVARRLDVPRQVVTALRERRISLVSIPRRFLQRFAEASSSSVAQLELAWGPAQLAAGAQLQGRRQAERRRAGYLRASADRRRRPGREARPVVGGGGLIWTAWSSPGKSPRSFTLALSHPAPIPGRPMTLLSPRPSGGGLMSNRRPPEQRSSTAAGRPSSPLTI